MRISAGPILVALSIFSSASAVCAAEVTHSIPKKLDGAVSFTTSGLNVDADGAPNSYLVDGKGLSNTCDGVAAIENGRALTIRDKNWYPKCQKAWANARVKNDYSGVRIFGFLANANGPVVQADGDPLPGTAYVTTTTLTVPGTPAGTQRHWADATKLPYIVTPSSVQKKFGIRTGDLAVVYWPKTRKLAYAVVGDNGGLGEASVMLHRAIGNDPVVMKDGVARASSRIEPGSTLMTLVFPGKRPKPSADYAEWNQSIAQMGNEVFNAWGGVDRLVRLPTR